MKMHEIVGLLMVMHGVIFAVFGFAIMVEGIK